MQVITLDESAFDRHAARLAKLVEGNSSITFDAIVAVRRGGSIVCDAFCRHFPKNLYGSRYDVTLQRPSTKRKNGIVGKLLKCLPTPILDLMRIAESCLLSLKHRASAPSQAEQVEIPAALDSILRNNANAKILVIDDAIDSGDTLYAISETLKKTNPDARISIAVVTETTRHPRIKADYTLYRNRTLIRFPWSNDYKKKG